MLMDDRRGIGILMAHLGACGSGELKIKNFTSRQNAHAKVNKTLRTVCHSSDTGGDHCLRNLNKSGYCMTEIHLPERPFPLKSRQRMTLYNPGVHLLFVCLI